MPLTVKDLLTLADEAREEIAAGKMDINSPLHISLEVTEDGNEDTYENRVHGGEPIEVCVTKVLGDASYVHIQVDGVPNFDVFQKSKDIEIAQLRGENTQLRTEIDALKNRDNAIKTSPRI